MNRNSPEQRASEKPGRNRNCVVTELGRQSPRHVGSFRHDSGDENVLQVDEGVLEGFGQDEVDGRSGNEVARARHERRVRRLGILVSDSINFVHLVILAIVVYS